MGKQLKLHIYQLLFFLSEHLTTCVFVYSQYDHLTFFRYVVVLPDQLLIWSIHDCDQEET